jgi:hypothetical protein
MQWYLAFLDAECSADLDTKVSPWSVADTVSRLSAVAAARGMKVFALIDRTKISYPAPAALAARYGLTDELAAGLAVIDALTSVVIDR